MVNVKYLIISIKINNFYLNHKTNEENHNYSIYFCTHQIIEVRTDQSINKSIYKPKKRKDLPFADIPALELVILKIIDVCIKYQIIIHFEGNLYQRTNFYIRR